MSKKGKVYLLNPGGMRQLSQKELDEFAGIGLTANPKKRKKSSASKKKRNSSTSNVGGKNMARRKKRKKTSRRKRTGRKSVRRNVRRKKARKSVRRKKARRSTRRKKARKTSRRKKARKSTRRKKARKSTRRKKARKTVRRKKSRRKSRRKARRKARRNPVAAIAENPRKRSRRKPRRKSRRNAIQARRNTPFLMRMNAAKMNDWPGQLRRHATAARKGHSKRRRGIKGYKRPMMSRGRYPIIRNPRNLFQNFNANVRALFDVRVLTDAAQLTVGSLGSPILAATLAKGIGRMTGKTIALTGVIGNGLVLVSGAGIAAAATAVTGKSAIGKNIIHGTVAGVMSDIGRKLMATILPAGAAPAATVTSPEAAAVPAGTSGVRQDVVREAMLGAYATASEIQRASLEEF